MTEARLHLAVADFLRAALRDPVRWTAIQPERRGAIEGARMKRRGVKAGVADICVWWPQHGVERHSMHSDKSDRIIPCGFLFLELKTDKGRLSAVQRDWQGWGGIHYAVVRSVDDAERALRAHCLTMHARVA